MGVFILTFAFTQGVFPKPPDFANLGAFDLSFFAGHLRFTLFLVTVIGVAGLASFALLSRRVRAFWARVRQGLTILRDRRRYFREVWLVQLGAWCFRFTAFWFLLEAFNIGGPPTPSASRSRSPRSRWRWASSPCGRSSSSVRSRTSSPPGAPTATVAATPPAKGLLQPLPRLAHERDGLGEDGRHHGADLGGLLLGVALQVDAVDRRDGHVDGELDRVVRPGDALGGLHLLRELLHPGAELIRVAEQVEGRVFHWPEDSL
jgi:hypothetical protein